MVEDGSESQAWIDDEFAASRFSDVRLGRRLRQLVTQMAGAVGGPIPLACQDWANTKAAYRFLSNSDVCEGKILQGHFQSTASENTGNKRGHPSAESTGIKRGQSC